MAKLPTAILFNTDSVEVNLGDGDTLPANITGFALVAKDDTIARFIACDEEGRLVSAPGAATTYTQAYANTSKVEVNHGLGQFPAVTVYETTRGTAFGGGGFGIEGFGLAGGALPEEIVHLGVGFVLFYVDDDNFTVLFPEYQQSGIIEWQEV